MRISTPLMSSQALESMLKQQGNLSKTQLQISMGKRMLSPADDPYNSSRSLDLGETVAINDQYQINAGHAENRLTLEEGTLEAVNNALQRIRELAITGNNDSQTVESRSFIAAEVEKLYDQLLALANTTDANNEYLFAGYSGKTKPFVPDASGTVQYYGDDGQRFLRVGPSTDIPVGDSGDQVFRFVHNGNGTFTAVENASNTGTGIVDPGSVVGTYIPDTFTVKFLEPTIQPAAPTDPKEYYVLNSLGEVIVAGSGVAAPGTNLYPTEAAFLAAVTAGPPPTDTGVAYEDGAAVTGLDQYGIQVYISGEPVGDPSGAGLPGVPGDQFIIAPSQNQDVFTTVKNMTTALTGPQTTDAERAHFHNAMNRVVADLDQGMGRILEMRAKVGARLNTVSKQVDTNDSFNLQMQKTLSQIQDLDYADAITKLNLQLLGLQTSQQSYAKIQGLSLFNYL